MVFLQCPYCKKDVSVPEATEDTQFCLEELTEGGYQLKHTHAYFYQVHVCVYTFCYITEYLYHYMFNA